MAADWQHHPDKISKVLGDRVKKGFAMKHEDYVAALQLAERCRARIDDAYDGIDAIISPCVKGEAPDGLELHRRAGLPAVLDGAERTRDVAADPHRARRACRSASNWWRRATATTSCSPARAG